MAHTTRTGLLAATLFAGLSLLTSPVLAGDEETFSGKLTVTPKYSYLYYFGEESGDSAVWYFETTSDAGKAITAVCQNKRDCYVSGMTTSDRKKPKEIPETTSGSWRVVSVIKASRKAF